MKKLNRNKKFRRLALFTILFFCSGILASAATFTVVNTGDSGTGSQRVVRTSRSSETDNR